MLEWHSLLYVLCCFLVKCSSGTRWAPGKLKIRIRMCGRKCAGEIPQTGNKLVVAGKYPCPVPLEPWKCDLPMHAGKLSAQICEIHMKYQCWLNMGSYTPCVRRYNVPDWLCKIAYIIRVCMSTNQVILSFEVKRSYGSLNNYFIYIYVNLITITICLFR